jgi:hypothetical protein
VPREWGQLLALSIAAVWIGLYPAPVWRAIAPATDALLAPLSHRLDQIRREQAKNLVADGVPVVASAKDHASAKH